MLRAGAVSSFFGTTRDTFEGKEVTHLEYEAYPEMALASMLEMCSKVCRVRISGEQIYKLIISSKSIQAREQWALTNIVVQHKLGSCPVGDVSIAIIVSSVHRKESLDAVHFLIDELKDKVPIWKKVNSTTNHDFAPTSLKTGYVRRSVTAKAGQSGRTTA
jgi:molybdopterin synthase catalytic subunit